MRNLLEIRDLSIRFRGEQEDVMAVKGVSLCLPEGGGLAIVGESGSGKSVTALSITRLLPMPPAEHVAGDIIFRGESVFGMDARHLRELRGGGVAYVFQEPATSLNPVFSIRSQLFEAIRLHRPEVRNLEEEAIKWLKAVGIEDAGRRLRDYPHQLSGGMQQRVMIAMALSCRPKLLVADEPTTALDVTIQAQILSLLKQLRADFGMGLILITHNFAIIRGLCERVAVMFRGEVVEQGETEEVLANPQHPYTRALIECVPRIGQRRDRLRTISVDVFGNGGSREKAQP